MIADIVLVELIKFPFPLPLKHAMPYIYEQKNKQTNKNLDFQNFLTSPTAKRFLLS